MVAGRGWIALALVTFGTWRPLRVFLGAYLFGGMTMIQMNLQKYWDLHSSAIHFYGAIRRNNYCVGSSLQEPDLDSNEHAGIAWQTVHSTLN